MIENTVGRGENAGYQHFLLFPNVLTFANDKINVSQKKVILYWEG